MRVRGCIHTCLPATFLFLCVCVCVCVCVFCACEPQENSRRQKTLICEKFDALFNALEERKQSLGQRVTAEQEEKLGYIRGLTQRYGAHLEASCRAVETGITAMEEPEMALFLQVPASGLHWFDSVQLYLYRS